MVKSLSIDALTDEEIERLTFNRIKKKVGDAVVYAPTEPNHAEVGPTCECKLCKNGVNLNRAKVAVCIRCNRASRSIEQVIKSVKTEERVLRSIAAEKQVDYIKAKALTQMRGGRARRGAKPNAERMHAVKNAIAKGLRGE